MLAAAAVLLLENESVSGLRRWLAQVFAAIIALVGGLTLLQHLSGWDAGIDQLMFHESVAEAGQSFPGRMGVAASLNFIFLGLAMIFLDARPDTKYWPSSAFAFSATAVTLLVFLYYFYGVEKFEAIAFYATIALHTVVGFLCLCAAVFLARPDRGILRELRGRNVGSVVARRLLPTALFLPILIGWFRVLGQREGLYGTGFGTALYCALLVLIFTGLVWRTALELNRTEKERKEADEALRRERERSTQVLESLTEGFYLIDSSGGFTHFNQAARKMFSAQGLDTAQIIGKHIFDDVFPEARDIPAGRAIQRTLTEHVASEAENFYEPWQKWFSVRNFSNRGRGRLNVFSGYNGA